MKQILALLAAAAMVFSISACGKKNVTEADMDKIEGQKVTESEASGTSSQEAADYDISIEDAKIIDTDEGKAILVEYKFKNNTNTEQAFDGIYGTEASQNGSVLSPATMVMPADGIDILSAVKLVGKNETAVAQKYYLIDDEETDVVVTVERNGDDPGKTISKTFNIK